MSLVSVSSMPSPFFSFPLAMRRLNRFATPLSLTRVAVHRSSRRGASTKPPKSSAAPSTSPSTPVHAIQAAAHFTGNYLDAAWIRQFIVGSLLQRFDPIRHSKTSKINTTAARSSAASLSNARAVEAALLECQRVFSAIWKLPVRPLDTLSETRILRLLARYAAGEGVLSDEALQTIQRVLHRLPGAPANVADPVQMRTLLELIGYVEPGDNLHRVAYAGELEYPPQAHAFMTELLEEARQIDGGDAFDSLRERREGPGYAIDSATTSEVDDAVGVCVDAATGQRYFVVYVSDATVYCPFDSSLEQVTARRLTTTTYLPEGVYFMLPKPIVDAATLREDRPCRTFNVIFQIDEATGEVKNYSVAVGWLNQLRRITYDQVQEMIDKAEKQKARGEKKQREDGSEDFSTAEQHETKADTQHPPPAWMTEADKANLFYILHCARIRLRARLDRQQAVAAAATRKAAKETANSTQQQAEEAGAAAAGPPMDFSLPDPLIKVKGTQVLSVTDQVISTQDARLAVAELMIAANEVCSRVAQAHRIAMPFRGTRALSSDHVVAHYFSEPQGVDTLASLDASHLFLAEAMQASVRRLHRDTCHLPPRPTVPRRARHHLLHPQHESAATVRRHVGTPPAEDVDMATTSWRVVVVDDDADTRCAAAVHSRARHGHPVRDDQHEAGALQSLAGQQHAFLDLALPGGPRAGHGRRREGVRSRTDDPHDREEATLPLSCGCVTAGDGCADVQPLRVHLCRHVAPSLSIRCGCPAQRTDHVIVKTFVVAAVSSSNGAAGRGTVAAARAGVHVCIRHLHP